MQTEEVDAIEAVSGDDSDLLYDDIECVKETVAVDSVEQGGGV